MTATPIDALAGLRVVDLSTGVSGPVATRLLAEAGADVVKVECPGGDPARQRWPGGFATWNRSKRGVVLDPAAADGRRALAELLARADVVVHDLGPTAAATTGLDDHTLGERHPHLIVAAVTGYPAGHPLQDAVAEESLVMAEAGFFDEQRGNRDGPVFIRMPLASWNAAYLCATGVLARLVDRHRSGRVGPVHTSLLQGALVPAALYWQRPERLPAGLTGHTLPKHWPDAALSIFRGSDGRWIQLAGAVGGWIESPPVIEALAIADRIELSDIGVTPGNREAWQEVFDTRSAGEWYDAFSEVDVPCTVVRDLGDCYAEEQSVVNGYVVDVDDPVLGPVQQVGPPVRTSPPSAVRSPAPGLGDHVPASVVSDWGDPRPAPEPAPTSAALPLSGLRVLDFGSVVAGPFGAQCLGDLGADVIKVEPLAGDRGRGLTQFAGCHRGKRSIALDLKAPDAQDVLRGLIGTSDVVLHNMRLAAAARLGIDGPGLRAVNPDMVFSHVSAYGPTGPMAPFPGYDPTAQALTGWERANVGDAMPPMWLRNSILDVQTGLAAAFGALVQLVGRASGRPAAGAETSLLAVGMNAGSDLVLQPDGRRVVPVDTIDPEQTGVAPTVRMFAVAGDWIAVAAVSPQEQQALLHVGGVTDALELPTALADRRSGELLAELHEAGVPCAPVRLDRMDGFFDGATERGLDLARTLETGGYGRVDLVAGFWSLPGCRRGAENVPELGADTTSVLKELGWSGPDIESLLAAGVARQRRHLEGARP